ncbi:MAG: potassium-transporting ATPase subunit C [Saprospiraceae bacterium]|nr:potassium-transporting ATPase subunit C [Saprospiraceae bacterium]
MKNNIIPAIRLTLVFAVLFCGIYTISVWGIAQAAQGADKGQIALVNGQRYHMTVGQAFSDERYFLGRPSAVDYNAAGSGGSNKGPSNPDYLAQVQARIDTFLVHNPGVQKSDLPSDLFTASGSGIDPHISLQAARVQVKRIARLRNLNETTLQQLVQQHTSTPLFGLFGTTTVHVLQLNLALDNLSAQSGAGK